MADRDITFFHSPHTRSASARFLLEELGAPYRLHALDMKAGQQREPAYLAINPMGKVPAIRHGEAFIAEQVAVFIYLADLFSEAGLAPAIGDPQRGPYLRWLVFYAASFEPAVMDRALKREPGPPGMVPYGDYDTMLNTLVGQLERGPYLLGERFSAADVLWGSALAWTVGFKVVPDLPVIRAYVERVMGRPAAQRARALDDALAAEQERQRG